MSFLNRCEESLSIGRWCFVGILPNLRQNNCNSQKRKRGSIVFSIKVYVGRRVRRDVLLWRNIYPAIPIFFLYSNRNAKKPLLVFLSVRNDLSGVRSSVRLEHRTFNPGVAGSIPVGPAFPRTLLY